MVAKIKLTIGDKVYKPGEKITSKLNKADEAFLRREGYIAEKSFTLNLQLGIWQTSRYNHKTFF